METPQTENMVNTQKAQTDTATERKSMWAKMWRHMPTLTDTNVSLCMVLFGAILHAYSFHLLALGCWLGIVIWHFVLPQEPISHDELILPRIEDFVEHCKRESKKDQQPSATKKDAEATCIICWSSDDVTPPLTLPCKHHACESCLRSWLAQCERNTCPFCNRPLFRLPPSTMMRAERVTATATIILLLFAPIDVAANLKDSYVLAFFQIMGVVSWVWQAWLMRQAMREHGHNWWRFGWRKNATASIWYAVWVVVSANNTLCGLQKWLDTPDLVLTVVSMWDKDGNPIPVPTEPVSTITMRNWGFYHYIKKIYQ